MRILHTSDWHFGRTLEGRSRIPEQEKFVDELCQIVKDEEIDLVMVAGDVFDTVNPPAVAEELFYDTMARLADGGKKGVVVIAGNHDNPERLRAAGPLAHRYGISLLGLPSDKPMLYGAGNNGKTVSIINGGPSWVEMGVPGCDHTAVILALPYPSEARLREVLSAELDDQLLQEAYSAKIARLFEGLSSNFRSDTVNLAMSHLFMLGGQGSDSERPINLGGALTVDPSALPTGAQYVALGHLHRPQKVGGPIPARYSGSPLAYSFSERGKSKGVIIADIVPGQKAAEKEIILSSGNPLELWVAEGGMAEVLRWIEEGRDLNAWIELELHLTKPLTNEDIQLIRSQRPGIINIRPVLPGTDQELIAEKRSDLSIDELFRRFYDKQTNGAQLDENLLKLFLELVNDDSGEVA